VIARYVRRDDHHRHMRRNRLERAFTFDRHFASAGFEIVPKRV
jgi:predicted nucleic acid-binding protein